MNNGQGQGQGQGHEQVDGPMPRRSARYLGGVVLRSRGLVDRGRSGRDRRHHRRQRPVGRLVAISVVVLMVAACSPYYSQDPGPGAPPHVVGIDWSSPQNQYDSDCALGLTEDGLTFVAGAATPWGSGGIAAEWLSYTITGSVTPIGASVGDCWNALADNGGQFGLLLQCSGEPVIKYWFDNMADAEAWVAIPYCRCNLTCQGMTNAANTAAWYAADRRNRFWQYCTAPQIDWSDVSCIQPSPNGWPLGRHGVSGGDVDGPLYGPDGSSLPPSWGLPFWDTTAPAPTNH